MTWPIDYSLLWCPRLRLHLCTWPEAFGCPSLEQSGFFSPSRDVSGFPWKHQKGRSLWIYFLPQEKMYVICRWHTIRMIRKGLKCAAHDWLLTWINLLPGQTCFKVPEVEVAVHIPEDEGVAFPGDACNTTHAALCDRRRYPHNKQLVVQTGKLIIIMSTKV